MKAIIKEIKKAKENKKSHDININMIEEIGRGFINTIDQSCKERALQKEGFTKAEHYSPTGYICQNLEELIKSEKDDKWFDDNKDIINTKDHTGLILLVLNKALRYKITNRMNMSLGHDFFLSKQTTEFINILSNRYEIDDVLIFKNPENGISIKEAIDIYHSNDMDRKYEYSWGDKSISSRIKENNKKIRSIGEVSKISKKKENLESCLRQLSSISEDIMKNIDPSNKFIQLKIIAELDKIKNKLNKNI